MLTQRQLESLEKIALQLRRNVIEMTHAANSGHPGGSCSIADIMAYLYFYKMNYNPNEPKWNDRDRLILSKGHAAPVLYAALAEAGFFPRSEMKSLRQIGHLLQGHPCIHIPGVDATTGSLGLGLSLSIGMALSARLRQVDYRVTTIIGDGESNEGQVWEAAMCASSYKLHRLTAIIDRNRFQNDGETESIIRLDPIADKWRVFGWNVIEIDGHDFNAIDDAFCKADECTDKPTCIIANTIKGKGFEYMCNQPSLHYCAPTDEQYEAALLEVPGTAGLDT